MCNPFKKFSAISRIRSKDVRQRVNLIQGPWMWVTIFTDDTENLVRRGASVEWGS